jgi:hypothetical protein
MRGVSLEPIGAVVILLGLLAILRGPGSTLVAFAIAILMGSAAVLNLPALGNASILVGHTMLVFLVLAMLPRPAYRDAALASLSFAGAGFTLLLVSAYGVLSSVFLPRIFAGATDVYSLARDAEEQARIVISGLMPRSTNITQGAYLAINLACFALAAAFVRVKGPAVLARALLIAAMANLLFAVIDLVTYATGEAELLSFVRNANYAILDKAEVAGLKRIVGLYPEASSFAYVTIGLLAYTARLWLGGVWTGVTGSVALLLLLVLLLSTSTTAYASLALLVVAIAAGCAMRLHRGQGSGLDMLTLLVIPPLALAVVLGVMLMPGMLDVAMETLNRTVVGKLDTSSAAERSRWNTQGLQAFADTYGFGAGVGSVRTSSFLVALLANTGVLGAALFALFLGRVLLAPRRTAPPGTDRVLAEAGAMGCLGLFISAAISVTSTDLGLLFFLFAALAAAPRGAAQAMSSASIARPRFRLVPVPRLAGAA